MSFTPTILAQVLNQVNRLDFLSFVQDNKNDKYVKNIKSWNILMLGIFANLSGIFSLRHLVDSFNSMKSKHYHLGAALISRNGLSYAFSKRESTVFKDYFHFLSSKYSRSKIKLGKNFNKYVSIVDSTSMPFTGTGSEWAKGGKNRCEAKGHVLLDMNGMPLDMVITGADTHDSKGLNKLNLGKTEVLVMDRAYYGFKLWLQLDQDGIIFVTRAKKNIKYQVVKRKCGKKSQGITEDTIIEITEANKKNPRKMILRRITISTTKGSITFITNDLKTQAVVICNLYKARWEIEKFFKWVKQNLKIKKFFGRSQNAIEIQLWIAMIVYLILCIIKQSFKFDGSNLKLIRIISAHLMENAEMLYLLKPYPKIDCKKKNQIDLFNYSGQ